MKRQAAAPLTQPGSDQGVSHLVCRCRAAEATSKLQFGAHQDPPPGEAGEPEGAGAGRRHATEDSASGGAGAGGGSSRSRSLSPGAASRALLTGRQQQAVGNLLRVQALVEEFVAKHDEDRITVSAVEHTLSCLRRA